MQRNLRIGWKRVTRRHPIRVRYVPSLGSFCRVAKAPKNLQNIGNLAYTAYNIGLRFFLIKMTEPLNEIRFLEIFLI